MNTIQKFENRQLEKLQAEKQIPDFNPGDTVRVNVKVQEGTRERIQAFEGVCIGRKNGSMNATFTVRKISFGEGVERVFPLWSSRIDSIELVRRGSVRRSKLYYLRDLRGKKARISERTTGAGIEKDEDKDETISKTERAKQKKEAKKAQRAENKGKAEKMKADKKKAKEDEKAKIKADAAAAEAAKNAPAEAPKE